MPDANPSTTPMTSALLHLPDKFRFGGLSYDKSSNRVVVTVSTDGAKFGGELSLWFEAPDKRLGQALDLTGQWLSDALADREITKAELIGLVTTLISSLPLILSANEVKL